MVELEIMRPAVGPLVSLDEAAVRAGVERSAIIDALLTSQLQGAALATGRPPRYWTLVSDGALSIKCGNEPWIFVDADGVRHEYINTKTFDDLRIECAALDAWAGRTVRPHDPARPLTVMGDTMGRIHRAVAAFPLAYPEWETKWPKSDTDIKPWLLKEAKLAKNDREANVMTTIIREHYRPSPDS